MTQIIKPGDDIYAPEQEDFGAYAAGTAVFGPGAGLSFSIPSNAISVLLTNNTVYYIELSTTRTAAHGTPLGGRSSLSIGISDMMSNTLYVVYAEAGIGNLLMSYMFSLQG